MVEKITFGAFFLEGSPTEIKDSNFERWSPCHHHSRCDYFCSTIKTNSRELGTGTQKFLGIIHYLGWYRNSTGKFVTSTREFYIFWWTGRFQKQRVAVFLLYFRSQNLSFFYATLGQKTSSLQSFTKDCSSDVILSSEKPEPVWGVKTTDLHGQPKVFANICLPSVQLPEADCTIFTCWWWLVSPLRSAPYK